ncbi:alpha/beta hydrolase [Streptomyces yangpuensis]|uniref:alpha/beta hydrolase n=1 Tax=Streptomyces yangpuensis TaxID=1648182 RepID=UPI003637EBE0
MWSGRPAGISPRPVYIGALAPDAGETPQDLIGKFDAPPLFSRLDNEEGRIWISRDGISDFVGDLPEAEQRVVWATQGAPREEVLGSTVDDPAWRSKPSWFLITTQDRAVDPELQRFAAQRMGATSVEVASAHVPMLSRPEAVLDLIRNAAASL